MKRKCFVLIGEDKGSKCKKEPVAGATGQVLGGV